MTIVHHFLLYGNLQAHSINNTDIKVGRQAGTTVVKIFLYREHRGLTVMLVEMSFDIFIRLYTTSKSISLIETIELCEHEFLRVKNI